MKNKYNTNSDEILIINKSGYIGDDAPGDPIPEIQSNAGGVQPLYPLEMEPKKEKTKIIDNENDSGVPALLPNGVTLK